MEAVATALVGAEIAHDVGVGERAGKAYLLCYSTCWEGRWVGGWVG